MCTYKDIDTILFPNGKTASEANSDASREIEHIYLDSWQRGVSVPFFDNAGNTYLANPDGSEDRVKLDRRTRTYRVLRRTAAPGCGRGSRITFRLATTFLAVPSCITTMFKSFCNPIYFY